MTEPRRQLAAIMFTDIVGYSAMAQENETLTLELLEEHRRLVRPLLAEHGGEEIETIGDAFHVQFSSALQAVRCAITIQGALGARNAGVLDGRKIEIRIGIHLADVEIRGDYRHGDGVNIAARIESLAPAGGIVISRSVYEQAHGKVEAEFASLGTPDLKNIDTPIEVFVVKLPWQSQGTGAAPKKAPNTAFKVSVGVGIVVILAAIAWFAFYPAPQSTLVVGPGDVKSLAVMPFVNLSSDPEIEFFGDGITEELLDELSRVQGLRVVPARASGLRLSEMSLQNLAAQLNVEAVLEGSVRKSGTRVRISAQLIRASDDTQLWTNSFDRELEDTFELQEAIAHTIVSQLGFEETE